MELDKQDMEMLTIAVPLVDYWEMKEEIDRLSGAVERFEKILECFIALYREERVKTWEMILHAMLKEQERKKGNWKNGSRT